MIYTYWLLWPWQLARAMGRRTPRTARPGRNRFVMSIRGAARAHGAGERLRRAIPLGQLQYAQEGHAELPPAQDARVGEVPKRELRKELLGLKKVSLRMQDFHRRLGVVLGDHAAASAAVCFEEDERVHLRALGPSTSIKRPCETTEDLFLKDPRPLWKQARERPERFHNEKMDSGRPGQNAHKRCFEPVLLLESCNAPHVPGIEAKSSRRSTRNRTTWSSA